MKKSRLTRTRFVAALAATSAIALMSGQAQALPVLFGGDNISVEGGGSTTDLAEGSLITVTGALLQLQLADGSTITVPKGSSFRITGEGDNVSIEVVSGAVRVDSKGTPITITHNGSSITTTGGAFSAFASESGGLDGRVNGGTATVVAGGDTREFSKGEGYLASEGGVSGTFTPPTPNSPQVASNSTDYSPADDVNADGSSTVADDAIESAGGGYGGTPPVTGIIEPVTGTEHTGHSIVYAADSVGIDQRTDITVTVGSGGELNRYMVGDGSNEDLERNSNQSLERGDANGEIFIERWAGGETHGNYYNDSNGETFSSLGRTSYQGFHVAYGVVGINIPTTGTATYTLATATSPTFDKGQTAPGTFTGTLGLTFGPTFKAGVDFTVSMPGDDDYEILTIGGSANPSATLSYDDLANGIFTLNNIAVAQGGIACPTSGCIAVIDGVIGGDVASSVGIAYQIIDFSSSPDDTYRSTRISGAAAFGQGSYTPGGGGGGGGGSEPASISSGSLDAPLRSVASSAYQGNAFLAPIQLFTREANITHDVVLDEDGVLIGFRSASNGVGTYALNDGVIADLAGTAYMQIGRWNGGDIQKNGSTYFSVAGWQGATYLIGIPTSNSNLPTSGIATYSLMAATAPIFASGVFAPGTLSGSAAVLFGAGAGNSWKLGLDAEVTMEETSGTVVYDISTAGGIVDPSQSPISGSIAFYDITSPVGSSICISATCHVDIRGAILAGPDGRDAGINYAIYNNSSDAIMGSAIFQVIGNPDLLRQDIGMTGFVQSPGTLALANSYGLQAFSDNARVMYTDSTGGIEQVSVSGNSNVYAAGSTEIVDKGTSGSLTWSRWTNGATGGAYFGGPGPVFTANQAAHVIVGTATPTMPTSGTAQYALAGYTAPTIADGSTAAGTFSGTLGVAFGASSATARVGYDFDVVIGGHTYEVATTGGSATPSTSEVALYGATFGSAYGHPAALTISTGGPACTGGTCKADVSGFIAGANASHAAIAYTISSSGSPNIANAVQGTAAFAQP